MKMVKQLDQVFGFNTKDLLKKLGQSMSLSKMLRICSITDLQPSSKICMKSGIMLNGTLFQLGPLELAILERDCGLLPTPTSQHYGTSQNGKRKDGTEFNQKGKPSLQTMAKNGILRLPTPTTFDSGEPLPPRKKNPSGGQKPPLVCVIGGKLNPIFVEYMMGYPADYTKTLENKESSNLEIL